MSIFSINSIKKISAVHWLAYILLAYFLLILLSYAYSYSINLEGMEMSFLYHLQVLEKFSTLYTNPDEYPFFICFYPPFYPQLMSWCCQLLQIDIFTDLHQAFVIGRLISLCLLFVNAFYIKKILELAGRQKVPAVSLLLLVILLFPMHFYTFRPDSLKVTFYTFFLYHILLYEWNGKSARQAFYALLFAVTSVFFKHDVILYILILLALSWIFWRKKETIYLTIIFLFLVFSGFLVITGIYGSHFLKNVFFYNIQYSGDVTLNVQLILFNLLKTLPLLVLAYKNSRSADEKIRFIAFLGLAYALVSNLVLLRAGANLNYTYESVILLILNFFLYSQTTGKLTLRFFMLLLYLFMFSSHLNHPLYFTKEDQERAKSAYLKDVETAKQLKKVIGKDVVFFTNGQHILFNSRLNWIYGYDLHLDRFTEVYLNLPIRSTMYSNTAAPKYDEAFKNGIIKYIVIDNNAVSARQMPVYYSNFIFYQKVGNLLIFKTKTLPLN